MCGRKEGVRTCFVLPLNREDLWQADFALEVIVEEDEERSPFGHGCDVEVRSRDGPWSRQRDSRSLQGRGGPVVTTAR